MGDFLPNWDVGNAETAFFEDVNFGKHDIERNILKSEILKDLYA